MKIQNTSIAAALSLIPLGQPLVNSTLAAVTSTAVILSVPQRVNAENAYFYYKRANDKFNRGVYKGDCSGAIADYNKAIEIDPKSFSSTPTTYNRRGICKSLTKDHSGAIADFSKAIEIDSKFSVAYLNRGSSKLELKDYQGAIADFNKAIEIDPKFGMAFKARGSIRKIQGEMKGACSDWRKASSFGLDTVKKKSSLDTVKLINKHCGPFNLKLLLNRLQMS